MAIEKREPYEEIGRLVVEEVRRMDLTTGDSYRRVAELVVDELNSVTKINAMLEMGLRLNKSVGPAVVGAIGFGCGNNCDAWGFGCGNSCLQGLPLTDELLQDRYAIDVLGNQKLTSEDMIAVQKDFGMFQETVTLVMTERLDSKRMEERIARYSK
jgi:hypothetical protein